MIVPMQLGDWHFKPMMYECISTKVYGDAYRARASIIIVNGQVHVYGLICLDYFNKKDFYTLAKFIKDYLKCDHYHRVRYSADNVEIYDKVNLK